MRCAYFGLTAPEIAAQLEEWDPSWASCSLVVETGGALAGFAGAELDETLGRAWLHGPLVREAQWDTLGARLLDTLVAEVVPAAIADLELAGDIANQRLGALARGRGFVAGVVNHTLEVSRPRVGTWGDGDPAVSPLSAHRLDELTPLHETLFPDTYYAASQLVAQAEAGEATLVGLVESGSLVGYAAGRIDVAGEGYLDFVGVSEQARGAGRGRRLVVSVCRALLEDPAATKVSLTVRGDNEPALALYHRLGFTREASLVGYRRRESTRQEPPG